MNRIGSVLLACAVLFAPPVQAATVQYSISFTATDFSPLPPLSDPVSASFDIVFDPFLDYSNQTGGINITSLNFLLGSVVAFSFLADDSGGGLLQVGGIQNGATGVSLGSNDFVFTLPLFPSVSPAFFFYSQASWGAVTEANTVRATVTAVPIPAALPLFGSALAAMGMFRWWRRRRLAAT
jgi:hypothetical protein